MKQVLILFLFLAGPLASGAQNPCSGKEIFSRLQGEPYALTLQATGKEWVQKNSQFFKNQKDLSSLTWGSLESPDWESPLLTPKKYDSVTYKFTVTPDCELKMATMTWAQGQSNPPKDINHVLLAGGEQAYTAGSIVLAKKPDGSPQIIVTNQSTRFCPPTESTEIAARMLENMGYKRDRDFRIKQVILKECEGKRPAKISQ